MPLTLLRRGRLTPVQQFNPIEFKTLNYHYTVIKVRKTPILTIFQQARMQGQRSGKIQLFADKHGLYVELPWLFGVSNTPSCLYNCLPLPHLLGRNYTVLPLV